jgi:ferredoxin
MTDRSPQSRKEIPTQAHLDPGRCRGHARCLTIAPEAFEFVDTEDRAVALPGGERLVDRAVLLEAMAECPEQAITLREETGED